MRECADERERAEGTERTVMKERVGMAEGAAKSERVEDDESAETRERADEMDGNGVGERPAAMFEGAEKIERADPTESAEFLERAAEVESTEREELPKHALGYPRIGSPSHHLWDAQQAGWPDHLPHEAWRDLVSQQRRDDQPKASSADHPAFAAGYVPNYAATPEVPSEDYVANRQGKARR